VDPENEENLTQPTLYENAPRNSSNGTSNTRGNVGATGTGVESDSDEQHAPENIPDHPLGLDIPFEPVDLSTRLPSGLLINSWRAVDALHLDTALVSPFKHQRLVPKEAMLPWSQAYALAANRLASAINSSARGRLVKVRRATWWYAALPALILRTTTMNSLKASKTILSRCIQFTNGDYGALINSWDSDYAKAISKPRSQRKDSAEKRLANTIDMIKKNRPHGISRATNMITGHGVTSCDNPNIREQMIKKHPLSTGSWEPHSVAADGSEDISLDGVGEILDATDYDVGVGPRGIKGHHVYCLNRALNPLANDEGPAINAVTDLGVIILSNACPWVTLALYGTLLTPLNKKAIGDDARPVAAEDRDCATWHKAAQRAQNTTVCKLVAPQQLAVAVSGGVEVKAWGIRLLQEEAVLNGSSFTINGEDRENAHNAFFRDKAVASIREAADADPSLMPFARLTDNILACSPKYTPEQLTNPKA
jgi:hypothetical protein